MRKITPVRVVLLSAALIVGVIGGAVGVSAVRTGTEGCTPGFWKNHLDAWEEYAPTDLVGDVFNIPAAYSDLADDTLLEALSYPDDEQGGNAAENLLRTAVAAILNAASEDVGYPYRRFGDPGNIIPTVNNLLAGGDEQAMEDFKDLLDAANNLGAEGFCD